MSRCLSVRLLASILLFSSLFLTVNSFAAGTDDNDVAEDSVDTYSLDSSRNSKITYLSEKGVNIDGKANVLWRNMKDGRVYLRLMDGLKQLNGKLLGEESLDWSIAGRGDFNGDNESDILWRNTRTGLNAIWMMNGDTVTEKKEINTVADFGWHVRAVGDFNGDGKTDILWHHDDGHTHIYLMDGVQIIGRSSVRYLANLDWQIEATSDFNGDGKADIFWRQQSTGLNYIWLMDGYTIQSGYPLNTVSTEWDLVGAGDLNGDGYGDIVWRNPIDGRNWVYLMKDGQIETSEQIKTVQDAQWQIKSVADFDGDGKADIFWHNQSTGLTYVYLMDGITITNRGVLNTVSPDWQVIDSAADTPPPPVTQTLPSLKSLTASATTIIAGDSVNLSGVFINGTGNIDNEVGSVHSNEVKSVSPSSTTTYTLTVTSSSGAVVTSSITITITDAAPPKIIAVEDQIESVWAESLNLPITGNDTVPTGAVVEIVTNPNHGIINVSDLSIEYIPSTRQEIVDEFSYKLVNSGETSNVVIAKITLRNAIVSADSTSAKIVENEPHSIIITTLLPVTEKSVIVAQSVDGLNVGEQVLTLTPGEIKHNIQLRVKELTFTGTLEESAEYQVRIESDDDEFYVNWPIFKLPDPNQLHTTLKPIWYNASESRRVVDQNLLLLTWTPFAPWAIPTDKTWTEDPYSSISWQLYYLSLAWLHGLEYRYDENKSPALRSELADIIMDYVHSVPRDIPINSMSWNDHTVAWRGEVLTYFYVKYLQDDLSEEDRKSFLKYMEDHIAELVDLLDDPRFFAHNHSMYHAISLYNMSFVFVDIAAKYNARDRALNRINELFTEMVNPLTGVSVEQSISYHLVALELFVDALENVFSLSNKQLIDPTLIFQRMVDFTLHFAFNNGGAPAMGDSNFDHTRYLESLISIAEKAQISTPYLDYLKGNGGLERATLYESLDDGYAIMRSGDTHTFVDFGKKLFSHGHHDEGNVTFAIDSDQILIDSGGPYQYDREQRDYFRSSYAHNTLVVNKTAEFLNDAQIMDSGCNTDESVCFVLGRISEQGYRQTRLVVTDVNNALYIYDDVHAAEQQDYELIFNLHPDTDSVMSEGTFSLTTKSGNNYYLSVKSNSSLTAEEFRGVENENGLQGWVQPKFGVKSPTTSIIYTASSEGFTGLSSFVKDKESLKDTGYQLEGNDVLINLIGRKIRLMDPNGDSPKVSLLE